MLPPNFPGYRPYCPYTADANAGGAWSAPDLAKARELVRKSGTAGAHVTFWSWRGAQGAGESELARTVFTQLGYRVSAKVFADIGAYYNALGKAAHEPATGRRQRLVRRLPGSVQLLRDDELRNRD